MAMHRDVAELLAEINRRHARERDCPRCNGMGIVVKTYDDYGMADSKDVPCPTCDGTGRVMPARRGE